jgi:glutaredoxin 3
MADTITLITKDKCPYCEQAKLMLQQRGIEYCVLKIGEDITRDAVISNWPEQKMVPIVIVNADVIGGYSDLLDYLNPPLDVTDTHFSDDVNPE